MFKVFLSHSSADKVFVRTIAKKLGEIAIIDERSFEAGVRTAEEIDFAIKDSKIFVIFLSDLALNSDWVQKELEIAIKLSKKKNLKLLVFSIDKKVTYTDKRLPEILRKEYNIQYLKNTEIVCNTIISARRFLILQDNPVQREVENLFVGRNTEIGVFENDFNRIDGNVPTFAIASNFYKGMGRRKFLEHSFRKVSLIKETQTPIFLTLKKGDSVESFIYKLNSYVYSDEASKADIKNLSIEDKIDIAINLVKEYKKNSKIIFIIDEGAIVLPNHKIVDWFMQIVSSEAFNKRTTFGVVSNWEPRHEYLQSINIGCSYRIDELASNEIKNLFIRLLGLYGINHMSVAQKEQFIKVLTGIPSQIIYTVNLIKASGCEEALRQATLIKTHSDSYSQLLVSEIAKYPIAYQVMLLLSKEMMTLQTIFEVFSQHSENEINEAIKILYDYSAIRYVHGCVESIKLNSTISDFICRSKLKLEDNYLSKLNNSIENYLNKSLDKLVEVDYSLFILAISKLIKENKPIPEKYYIAPLLIDNIINEYNLGHYDSVEHHCIELLKYRNYDSQVIWELQYYLVKVYARTGSEKFWNALRDFDLNLDLKDKYYLTGFYYRNCKGEINHNRALEYYFKVISLDPTHQRALREIVTVYILLEQYDKALEYAKSNYETNPIDILHIHSYFISLIRSKSFNRKADTKILETLMNGIQQVNDSRAEDISKCMEGEYAFYVDNDINKAESILNDALVSNQNRKYPLKSLLAIYRKRGDKRKAINVMNLLAE